jgi:DNA-binding CsgD family transcriptional regulator
MHHVPAPAPLIQSILSELVDAAGLDTVGWLALPSEQDTLTLTHVHGDRTGALHGLSVPIGRGLTGTVAQSERACWVDDYFTSAAITHDFDQQVAAEGISRMVSVPLLLESGNRGALTLAVRTPGTFADRFVDQLSVTARKAVVTVSRAFREWSSTPNHTAHSTPTTRFVPDGIDPFLLSISAKLAAIRHKIDNRELSQLLGDIEVDVFQAAGQVSEPAAKRRAPGSTSNQPRLTPREHQVLVCVAAGGTNAAIGHRLGLTANTVKTYWQSVMHKLEVGNRAEAVSHAYALGLLAPPPSEDVPN